MPSSVYFFHIEKTAGTSLTAWLAARLPGPVRHLDTLEQIRHLAASLPPDGPPPGLWRGHLRLSVVRHYLPRLPPTIVWLRDPRRRTLSHLAHIQRNPVQNAFLRQHLPINDLSLDELLEQELIRCYLSNFMVKKLALPYDPAATPQANAEAMFDPGTDPGLLETARKRLAEFAVIGLVERPRESLASLARLLDGPDTPGLPRRNAAPGGDAELRLSAVSRRHIDAMIEGDRALYRYGSAKLEKQP